MSASFLVELLGHLKLGCLKVANAWQRLMQRYDANAEYTRITVAPSVGSEDDNHLGGRGSVESGTKGDEELSVDLGKAAF